jgi:hypothetical protein
VLLVLTQTQWRTQRPNGVELAGDAGIPLDALDSNEGPPAGPTHIRAAGLTITTTTTTTTAATATATTTTAAAAAAATTDVGVTGSSVVASTSTIAAMQRLWGVACSGGRKHLLAHHDSASEARAQHASKPQARNAQRVQRRGVGTPHGRAWLVAQLSRHVVRVVHEHLPHICVHHRHEQRRDVGHAAIDGGAACALYDAVAAAARLLQRPCCRR